MIARWAWRMLTETDRRALARFAIGFGWQGMHAVRRFSDRVQRGEYFPAFVFISVTSSCNLRCQGCWASPSGPARALEPEALDRIVSDSVRRGTSTFGILGGEPLLYPDLAELFERHPDCYFLLFTNGTLLTDEVADRLRRLANVSPLISVEGSERVSDQRRGGSGVLHSTLDGVRASTRHGLVTGVATSVCRSNIDDLVSERFVDELVERGVHYLWYYIYRPVGADPAPELALSEQQILDLRRFMVDIRSRVPLLVVDSYWDHEGRGLCPAAVGIGHHIGPGGDIEACPPIQFALEKVGDDPDLFETFTRSAFLHEFREVASSATRGCILMERPDLLEEIVRGLGARDSSGRATALSELRATVVSASHDLPGQEIPERYWPYRLAKKHWFFGFGAYG